MYFSREKIQKGVLIRTEKNQNNHNSSNWTSGYCRQSQRESVDGKKAGYSKGWVSPATYDPGAV